MEVDSEILLDDDPGKGDSALGLQKVNKLEAYLPNKLELQRARQRFLHNLKANAFKALLAQDESLDEWINACTKYIDAFSYAFTKEEHILLVKICVRALDLVEHDLHLLVKLIKLTALLLKKCHLLSRRDLVLDWRLFYRLFERTQYSPHNEAKTLSLGLELVTQLGKLLSSARVYFAAESTREMLAEWRQYLCVYSGKFTRYLHYCSAFLPTLLLPEEQSVGGHHLWLDEFFKLWTALPNGGSASAEKHFLTLFSTLAMDAKGFVDWDPYLPVIFERFMKNLHVDGYKSQATQSEIALYVHWIVYAINENSPHCLDHFRQLFRLRSVNYFISKEKTDALFQKIITSALDSFAKRLRAERYKKNWHNFAPRTHILSERTIEQFAGIIVENIDKISFNEFDVENLYKLCMISAPILSQKVIDKLEVAYEQVCEPKRLKSALQLFSVSLFPIVTNPSISPQYRANVLPILSNLVASINTYDHNLCYLQMFTVRCIVVLGIPLRDCSSLAESSSDSGLPLDDQTSQLLLDTRQLEDFGFEFLRCCFTILESNNEDLFRLDKNRLSLKELLFETFLNVLTHSPVKTRALLCTKLYDYATSQIFESEQCCAVLSKLLEATFSINARFAMDKFFTVVARNTLATIGGRSKFADICKSELLYNLNLLNVCFILDDGAVLLEHQAAIEQLLSAIVGIDFEEKFMIISRLFASLFVNLTRHTLLNRAALVREGEKGDLKSELMRATNWPQTCPIKNVHMDWHVPSEEEIAFARKLLDTFIYPQMSTLTSWADSKLELSKAQLEKSLHILLSFCGALYSLPDFAGQEEDTTPSYLEDDIFLTSLFEGSTFRDDLVLLTEKLLKRMITTADNASLLKMLARLLDYALFPYELDSTSFDFRKIYQPLTNDTFWLPSVHYSRMDQYQNRLARTLKGLRNRKWTKAHSNAVQQLLYLSTCHLSSVRAVAQALFAKLYQQQGSRATQLIVPQLMANLQNAEKEMDAFEGSLYLLIGTLSDSMLFRPSHKSLYQLWPLLIQANFAEKLPQLAAFLDSRFFPVISTIFMTIPIKRSVLASGFDDLIKEAKEHNFAAPSIEEVQRIEAANQQWSKDSQSAYLDFVNQMIQTMAGGKLQWRFHTLGTFVLSLLLRSDLPPTAEWIGHFLDNFVHDSIYIRATAMLGLKKILFLNRPTKETVQVQYEHGDSQVDIYASEAAYRGTVLHDRVHAGYYPGAYTTKKASANGWPAANGFIAERFNDAAFLDKLFHLYSVESTKTIDRHQVKIWKYLFQNFKLFNAELLFPRIEQLLKVDKHSHDKLALEIMSGLVKAAPWLDYSDALRVKSFLSDIISKNLASFNSESYALWKSFAGSFFTNRDIRRGRWVLQHLSGPILFLESTSPYYQSAFLHFLQANLQSNFKYPEISAEIISKLTENLSHPYHNVRLAIADLLCVLFPVKVGIHLPVDSAAAGRRVDFVQRIVAPFESAMSSLFTSIDSTSSANMTLVKSAIFDFEATDGKLLLNLVETVCHWITSTMDSKMLCNAADFLPLFPYLCLVQSNNAAVQNTVKNAITKMGKQTYSEAEIEQILQLIEKISSNWNWHSRKQIVLFTQHFAYTNIFSLTRNDRWMDSLLRNLSTLLEDEVIEVRESACLTLSSLLIWNAIKGEKLRQLVEQFKAKARKKVKKVKTEDGQRVVDTDDLRVKHGGVLGLCAFLYAYPDDLPAHLPDILLFLTEHMSGPQPIPKSITTALSTFKKFHMPNWVEYKRQFTADQLSELNNVLISPSYYA